VSDWRTWRVVVVAQRSITSRMLSTAITRTRSSTPFSTRTGILIILRVFGSRAHSHSTPRMLTLDEDTITTSIPSAAADLLSVVGHAIELAIHAHRGRDGDAGSDAQVPYPPEQVHCTCRLV
jgi:hypothetical protein